MRNSPGAGAPLHQTDFQWILWDCQQSRGDQVSGKIKEDKLTIGVCSAYHMRFYKNR